MKKLITIIILVIAFSLTGCSTTSNDSAQEALQSTIPDSVDLQPSQPSVSDQVNKQQEQGNTAFPIDKTNTVARTSTPGYGAGTSTPLNNDASNSDTNTPTIVSTLKPTEKATVTVKPKNTITISITGSSSWGVIVDKTRIDFEKGMTVLDALKEITRQKDIELDWTGGLFPGTEYVKSIDELKQFDEGPGSGWLYAVNGVSASISCGSYKLNDGDDIEWRYSLDLGKDIGWNQR